MAALLSDAASGQRPWVNADVQQLLSEARGGGGGSAKSARMRDPAARKRFVERFAAKTAVYEGCRMYSRDGELLCHTGARRQIGAISCASFLTAPKPVWHGTFV